MKATFTVGNLVVEIDGNAAEVLEVLSARLSSAIRKTMIAPRGTQKSARRREDRQRPKKGRAKRKVKRPASLGRAPVTRWSKDEDAKLKAHHKTKTIAELSKIIGRSKQAITQRIIKLRNAGELRGD